MEKRAYCFLVINDQDATADLFLCSAGARHLRGERHVACARIQKERHGIIVYVAAGRSWVVERAKRGAALSSRVKPIPFRN